MSTLGTMVSLEDYLVTAYEPDCDFVDGNLELHYEALGMRVVPELRIRVAPGRVRIPDLCLFLKDPRQAVPTTPPFLCIEILSPEDRMSRIEVRINDYLSMGVPWVWVLDPETRQAYVATSEDGLREVKSGVLRTESPAMELPLSEVFE